MSPMEKAPPQSSMIRQGQGSLAYSSILTLQRSFAICSCENCACPGPNFDRLAKNQVMGKSNTGLTSMAMAMNTTACDYIDDASVYAFLITPILRRENQHGMAMSINMTACPSEPQFSRNVFLCSCFLWLIFWYLREIEISTEWQSFISHSRQHIY